MSNEDKSFLMSDSNGTSKDANVIDHPKHYQGQYECIDLMRALFGNNAVKAFCKCNSFKYRFRAQMKGGEQDIKKAEWYEDYLIEMIREENDQYDEY